jgi:hypothetical protein
MKGREVVGQSQLLIGAEVVNLAPTFKQIRRGSLPSTKIRKWLSKYARRSSIVRSSTRSRFQERIG